MLDEGKDKVPISKQLGHCVHENSTTTFTSQFLLQDLLEDHHFYVSYAQSVCVKQASNHNTATDDSLPNSQMQARAILKNRKSCLVVFSNRINA